MAGCGSATHLSGVPTTRIAAETEKWAEVVRFSGAKAD
jgi:hypothetical protein